MLQVHDLVSGYGKIIVLNNVNLTARADQVTGIIGPNGSGKSTLLKTVFGHLTPQQGSVVYNGTEITAWKPPQVLRTGLAYVPQSRALFSSMTVTENLILAGYSLRSQKRREAVNKIYSLFPLMYERRHQIAGSMSGGEQRLLEIARALVLNPTMILLDEPSAALSPKLAEEVYEYILQIHRTGTGFVIVEQNVLTIMEHAHIVYAMELGRNSFSGTPSEFRSDSKLRRIFLGAPAERVSR